MNSKKKQNLTQYEQILIASGVNIFKTLPELNGELRKRIYKKIGTHFEQHIDERHSKRNIFYYQTKTPPFVEIRNTKTYLEFAFGVTDGLGNFDAVNIVMEYLHKSKSFSKYASISACNSYFEQLMNLGDYAYAAQIFIDMIRCNSKINKTVFTTSKKLIRENSLQEILD